jgi:hypothetical protein
MNGFVTKRLLALAALLVCGGAAVAGDDDCWYRRLVDPCYPQRYEYMSRKEEQAAFGAQVARGHMLDQTVWNYHFVAGTDQLNMMGLDHLATLARRLPQPDTLLFVQTAQDVTYDPAAPEKMSDARAELNAKRIAAIQKFLLAQKAGCGLDFQVVPIDPPEVGLAAIPVNFAINQLWTTRFRGGLPTFGGNIAGGFGTSGGGGR